MDDSENVWWGKEIFMILFVWNSIIGKINFWWKKKSKRKWFSRGGNTGTEWEETEENLLGDGNVLYLNKFTRVINISIF